MTTPDDIEKFIKETALGTKTEMNEVVRNRIFQAFEKSKQAKSALTEPNMWRIIMKSRMTKLATAAVIIIAAVVLLTVLDKSTTPTWALEQTIETLREIESIHISGYFLTGDAKKANFQAWIIPSVEDSSKSSYFRFEAGRFEPEDFNPYDQNRHVVVVSEKESKILVLMEGKIYGIEIKP